MQASSNNTLQSSSGKLLHPSECPLHELVFKNDILGLTKVLGQRKRELFDNLKDHHGNTPLHLAVMLGRKDCILILLKHEHPILLKNACGWTVLQEAVSYGDRSTILAMFKALSKERKRERVSKKPEITKALNSFGGDFVVKMIWDFQSWIPFVSRVLPSDVCMIYRKGTKIRMNSTLEDFAEKRWVRGDLSYIIDFESGTPDEDTKIMLLDNNKKVYLLLKNEEFEEMDSTVEESTDLSMSNDISDASMKTTNLSIDRVNSGWIFRRNKTQLVGEFEADFYKVTGLTLVTKKRREHLSDEDLRKNKLMREAISRGESTDRIFEECSTQSGLAQRSSLPPPTPPHMTWAEYSKAPVGTIPHLGRPKREKITQKSFEATLGMSQDFPIKLEDLLPVLEALGPKAKVFKKLRDFITIHLPPGFPIRIDIPVFPSVKATVSFPEFEFKSDLPDSLFTVPSDYKKLTPPGPNKPKEKKK